MPAFKLKSPHGHCPRCGGGLVRQLYGYPMNPHRRLGRWQAENGCEIPANAPLLVCADCHQELGYFGVQSQDFRVDGPEPGNFGYGLRPWPTWLAFQWAVLRSLDLQATRGDDLAVPQNICGFRFGPQKMPLPVGALRLIWKQDKASRPRCPRCGKGARAYAFGGLLSVGGYSCRCLHCGQGFLKQLGGLAHMAAQVEPILKGTPWAISGATFGGAYGDDGRQLGQALHLGGWDGPGPKDRKAVEFAAADLNDPEVLKAFGLRRDGNKIVTDDEEALVVSVIDNADSFGNK